MSLIIGSHVGVSAPKMLLGAVEEALSYGANTFMFYTGAPQNTYRRSILEFKVEEAIKLMKEANINIDNVMVHAPYILNFANPKTLEFSIEFFLKEMERVATIGIKYLILHPGAHVGLGSKIGINNIINSLNTVLRRDNSNVVILLETLAGKGTEVGINLIELSEIIAGVENKSRIGVCLDTCHLHDSGVDLCKFDDYLMDFNRLIGLKYLKCLHINDSKNVLGAKKDRHENLGLGAIGFDNLMKIIHHEKLENVPKILETPYINDHPPYGIEIKMIKERKIDHEAYERLRGVEQNG